MPHRDSVKVDSAIHDADGVYASPMDVVNDDDLDPADKKRILDSWQRHVLLLSGAEAGSIRGGERGRLREVIYALAELARRSRMQ